VINGYNACLSLFLGINHKGLKLFWLPWCSTKDNLKLVIKYLKFKYSYFFHTILKISTQLHALPFPFAKTTYSLKKIPNCLWGSLGTQVTKVNSKFPSYLNFKNSYFIHTISEISQPKCIHCYFHLPKPHILDKKIPKLT